MTRFALLLPWLLLLILAVLIAMSQGLCTSDEPSGREWYERERARLECEQVEWLRPQASAPPEVR